jgi:hypothetical protein
MTETSMKRKRNTGQWWLPRQMRLEQRASVKRHFEMWREATTQWGAIRYRINADGEQEQWRLHIDPADYVKAMRKHKQSWCPKEEPGSIRIGLLEYELAA